MPTNDLITPTVGLHMEWERGKGRCSEGASGRAEVGKGRREEKREKEMENSYVLHSLESASIKRQDVWNCR